MRRAKAIIDSRSSVAEGVPSVIPKVYLGIYTDGSIKRRVDRK